MRHTSSRFRFVSVFACTLAAANIAAISASGQSPPATSAPAEPLLSGPAVEETSGRKTLVQREFAGALVRLEERAEIAAIKLLELDAGQQEAVDKTVSQRATAVNDLTFAHLDLYLELQSARQSGTLAPGGDVQAQRELGPKIRQMREYAAPLLDPPLVEQIAAALPQAKRDEYRALVKEYTDAQIAEQAGSETASMTGEQANPQASPRRRAAGGGEDRLAQRYEFNQLLREMARSLNAVVSDRREQFDQLIAAVNATPEQAEQIQRILREAGAASRAAPSPEQRAATARKVMDVLTPEQRELLRKSRQRP